MVKNKTALVVEGGAMRGIFSTGVLDAFLSEKFNPFDFCIGVSAGSTNLAAYLAGMYQRNYRIYTDYSLRKDFISWKKFLTGGHLVDLDWLWDITIREIRLDLKKIIKNKCAFIVVATDVTTGNPEYFYPDVNNLELLIKASSAIPLFYRGFINIQGRDYTDGGLSDPIPVIEAYKRGARNIIVIRSRTRSHTMKSGNGEILTKILLRKNPALVTTIKNRPAVYQSSIDFIRNHPTDVNIYEINPPDDFKTGRLTKDISVLKKDYELGYNTGISFIKNYKHS